MLILDLAPAPTIEIAGAEDVEKEVLGHALEDTLLFAMNPM